MLVLRGYNDMGQNLFCCLKMLLCGLVESVIWGRIKCSGNIIYNKVTVSQTTNFRLFQTERVADDNFESDENGRKFSKWVENTVGKGEIALYEQFLLFPHCFQETCTANM